MPLCDYCRGPITAGGHPGRPWPGRAAAAYCCYGCLSLGEQQRQLDTAPALPAANRNLGSIGVRLGVALIVVAQSMIFGLALNLHDDVPPDVRWGAQTLILVATLVVVALLGPPLFRAAWLELRRGRVTVESLFLLTMFGALGASLQAHSTGRGKIYFEVVSILLVVYTLGKMIGARSRAAAMAGARAWAGQLDMCRLVDDRGRTRSVLVREVLPGDVVEVNPGETFAVDGVIRSGTGFVSEAAVTGEPFAAVRRPGDRVLAGAASHDAAFHVEATAPGTERQVDRLLAAVEGASDRPVSLQARADALGRWFLPLVVCVALGTFAYWTLFTAAGWEAALFHAMSVLLVACPCVIGLATPVVVWSALGRLAERGVIVRAADAVERLAEVDHVMLDKTGTLTDDSLSVLDVVTAGTDRERLLGWLSVIEEKCNHPVARAFAKLPRPAGDDVRVRELRVVPGCGVEAEIEAGGSRHLVQIGTPQWIAQVAKDVASSLAAELRASGHRVDVSLDGRVVAAAALSERVRDSVPEALTGFRNLGLAVEVLTGDTAERAAGLGLPVRAGLLPADKLRIVEAATASGAKSLFVGDGINDAAALAAAHAGIALASGTDLAVGAADVTLYHTDLRAVPWAVELSREAVRAARRNTALALAYNLVGMTLAACGALHPVVAALLMLASSLSLVFSSARVGTRAGHCFAETGIGDRQSGVGDRPAGRALMRAALHGLAVALQGVAFVLLLDPSNAALVIGGFALAGVVLAWAWNRWAAVPHALDMCFGMLTLGNLGMLLGWWADAGFEPLRDHGCCACVEAVRSGTLTSAGMWGGMLLFANAAMLWLPRRPVPPGGNHGTAMFTGGNAGMVLGMVAGGWCAALPETDSVALAVAGSFVGMTAGMLAGMLLGTWLAEKALDWLRSLPVLRATWRAGVAQRVGE
ncbi:heavy metal translocating p-type atpase : Heavy metal translocating P-type ATPase OS=Isosphaera pallida (strain ATCC 43644 / DSM 9630 / IS1B) GN=Isop_0399 PE=3 SV=1: E1-E2_ATPase: Hydrolase [Gemmataceae bacterium]|nr:heavy metal translocating p-type atpase : Heavy metal translocating P-type ATPase OS=Isosphaera pallida (strain ATCC 43644 / DSM 9630 / IS1B) GN=Isop_0399 PE=3 SV=1: E1-E2_ATPase: Hydrolase [Gemmataceae bacterium]VTU02204.1 heavy metal translocating p-type atpase : Heavy metal translocating P-type ATPase OS=Isosphaera pallida (strain ATCC 43644 / DSM 9630 / IS1B) GN=Isop_0399 PE=3 SV=1: E1-E2_ATPase: Hydrolase [Gemmataceae bacterium]